MSSQLQIPACGRSWMDPTASLDDTEKTKACCQEGKRISIPRSSSCTDWATRARCEHMDYIQTSEDWVLVRNKLSAVLKDEVSFDHLSDYQFTKNVSPPWNWSRLNGSKGSRPGWCLVTQKRCLVWTCGLIRPSLTFVAKAPYGPSVMYKKLMTRLNAGYKPLFSYLWIDETSYNSLWIGEI